jgi:hypothetical protein
MSLATYFGKVRAAEKLRERQSTFGTVASQAGGNREAAASVRFRHNMIAGRLSVGKRATWPEPASHRDAAIGTPVATIV